MTKQEVLVESFHLAEIIEDEMRERGWNLDRLVMEMGPHFTEKDWQVCRLSWEMFMTVREPYIALGDVMAEQLSAAFGASPKFFINFHELWRKSQIGTDRPEVSR